MYTSSKQFKKKASSKNKSHTTPSIQFKDNRPTNSYHADLKESIQESPKSTTQLAAIESITAPLQKKENKTGLPDQLKSGIERLSGIDISDTRVHYNSAKPAQLQAHAYAQGNQIHIASGQEKHLAHEAWHVVQQKQGRVQPTKQMKGKVTINDDGRLEKEADVMGAKAMQIKGISKTAYDTSKTSLANNTNTTIQRVVLNAGAELETQSIKSKITFKEKPSHDILESVKGALWNNFQKIVVAKERGEGWNLTSDLSQIKPIKGGYELEMNLETIIGYSNDGLKTDGEFQKAVDEVQVNLGKLSKANFKSKFEILQTKNPERGNIVPEKPKIWNAELTTFPNNIKYANWSIHLTAGVPLGAIKEIADHKAEVGNATSSKKAEYKSKLPGFLDLIKPDEPLESMAPAIGSLEEVKPMINVLDGLIYVFGQYLKSAERGMPDQGPKHGMSVMPRTDFVKTLTIAATLLHQMTNPEQEVHEITETYQGLIRMLKAIAKKHASGNKKFVWTNNEVTLSNWISDLTKYEDSVAKADAKRHKQVGGLGKVTNPVHFKPKKGMPSLEDTPIYEFRREGATTTPFIKTTLIKIMKEVTEKSDH